MSRPRARGAGAVLLGVWIAVGACACASAPDVERRSRAVWAMTDPEQHGYCPAEQLALARVEVEIAQAASERGEAVVAALHLERAERHAAEVARHKTTCTPARSPGQER